MDQPSITAADRLLSAKQVSDWIGIPQTTLRYWRWAGTGPRWFRVGPKQIKYREADVQAWLDQQYTATNPKPAA